MQEVYPSEFVVSNHAKERLTERLQCNPRKIIQVTKKAWQSVTPPSKAARFYVHRSTRGDEAYKGFTYKYFMGLVFVFKEVAFSETFSQKTLVTVIKN